MTRMTINVVPIIYFSLFQDGLIGTDVFILHHKNDCKRLAHKHGHA
jgi:hypothetical protein